MPLTPLLRRYDHVLLDLDGCVRVGDRATPQADAAIAALRAAGKGIAFVTNDPSFSPEEVVRQLWGLGVRAAVDEVVTVGAAVQSVCAQTPGWRTAYVIGPEAMHRHVATAGLRHAEQPDVVVVANHHGFGFAELQAATRAVLGGAALLTAGRDATYPTPEGPAPGTGAVIAAVEAATGATAVSVGKPEAPLFATALDRLGGPPADRVLVVGDRLDADAEGARRAGLDCAIVLTGVSARAEADAALRHDASAVVAVAEDLARLVQA